MLLEQFLADLLAALSLVAGAELEGKRNADERGHGRWFFAEPSYVLKPCKDGSPADHMRTWTWR